MKLYEVILIFIHLTVSSANFKNDQEYFFQITDQQFIAINIRGKVIPPVDTVFEGALHLRALPNNTLYGKFSKTTQHGNVNNKGNLERPFLIEAKENRIESIQVSKEWEKKGIRYVYDVMKHLLRDYTILTRQNDSVANLQLNLPLGLCNATVNVIQNAEDKKIIEAKCDKSKCELDQDLLEIIGDEAEELFTDDTFNDVKMFHEVLKEPFARLEVTTNIRGEDPLKEFLVAIVSNIEVTFVESNSREDVIKLEGDIIKHGRKEILEY